MRTIIVLLTFVVLMASAHLSAHAAGTTDKAELQGKKSMPQLLITTMGGQTFHATLVDSETTSAFQKILPLTLTMEDLHGNEKYYYFTQQFPGNAEKVRQINKGDIMLYGNDCLVIFYKNFSTTYTYTRLAHIDDPTDLEKALGKSDATVTFQLKH